MTSQERPAGRGQRKDDVLRELRADGALTAAELGRTHQSVAAYHHFAAA